VVVVVVIVVLATPPPYFYYHWVMMKGTDGLCRNCVFMLASSAASCTSYC